MWFFRVLLLPLDIVDLGGGFDLFIRDGNCNQLRVVIMAMIRLELLQLGLDV